MRRKFLPVREVILLLTVIVIMILVRGIQCDKENFLSPPPTALGAQADFDKILKIIDAKWSFIFNDDNERIIKTDVYGAKNNIILDIKKECNQPQAHYISFSSPSPDFSHMIVCFSDFRFNNNDAPKLLLLNLNNYSTRILPASFDGFHVKVTHDHMFWLGESVFLVAINRFTTGKSKMPGGMPSRDGYAAYETVKYLYYDLDDLEHPIVISLDSDHPDTFWMPNKRVLLFASEKEPINKRIICAFDINGRRLANVEEVAYFRFSLDGTPEYFTGIPTIATRPVVDSTEIAFEDDFAQKYWNRYFIYLDTHIVRISSGLIDQKSMWDPDMEMFRWDEWLSHHQYITLQMDIKGHYRIWRSGRYLAKVPKGAPVK